ncbi:MAG: ABC transporter permease [Acidobacteria bacterium]|nr:ABC transporter permease [Acidobacteriota bacterium]
MTSFLQDLRYGVRMLLRNKVFTLVAMISIALGAGGNAAMFSIINSVLLRPLPFKDPSQLAAIWSVNTKRDHGGRSMSYPDFKDLRAASQTFEGMAAWSMRDLVITGKDEPLRVHAAVVDAALFPLLGKPALLGRTFDASNDADRQSVILSHALWKARFGASRDVEGQNVVINDTPYSVIGVMPEDFKFPIQVQDVDVWMKITGQGLHSMRDARLLGVIGRLKQGRTLEEAGGELRSLAGALSREYPASNADISVGVVSFSNHLFGDVRRSLFVLFAAVGLVLLIACVTVANLQIARSSARYREMAIRNALGATRSRIIRQLLVESMTLAFAGGILGAFIAFVACRSFVGLSPWEALQLREINFDWKVALFTLAVVSVTGLLFGIIPALRLSRAQPSSALGERAANSAFGPNKRYTQSTLIISQIAITLALLVGAGLLINGIWRMRRVNVGVETSNVLTANLALSKTYNPQRVAAFYNELQQQLQAIPTVRSVSAVVPLPFTKGALQTDFKIEGDVSGQSSQPNADLILVQPGYFKTMGIMSHDGRDFSERDNDSAPPVAIINRALAARYFNGVSPIGRHIEVASLDGIAPSSSKEKQLTIVGVVGDIRRSGVKSDVRPELYVPLQQRPFREVVVILKTDGSSSAVIGSVRAAVRKLDGNLPIYNVSTLDAALDSTFAQDRFNMILLLMFAGIALFLTLVGLHGVMAQFVAQRRKEIAIRMAVGASQLEVLKMIVGQGMALVIGGLVLGVLLALTLTGFMKTMLFEVSATDPLTFVIITLLMAIMAFVACYIPAKSASEVDPMNVLRTE